MAAIASQMVLMDTSTFWDFFVFNSLSFFLCWWCSCPCCLCCCLLVCFCSCCYRCSWLIDVCCCSVFACLLITRACALIYLISASLSFLLAQVCVAPRFPIGCKRRLPQARLELPWRPRRALCSARFIILVHGQSFWPLTVQAVCISRQVRYSLVNQQAGT